MRRLLAQALAPARLAWVLWGRPGLRGLSRRKAGEWGRFFAVAAVGVAFLGLIYGVLKPTLGFLAAQEVIGPLLIARMAHILFMVFLALQVFSHLILALNGLFLDPQAQTLLSTPMPPWRLFVARGLAALAQSAWMLVLLWLPVALALRKALEASWLYSAWSMLAVPGLALWGAAVSTLALLLALRLAGPGRLKRSLVVLMGLLACGLIFTLRAIQPERLTNAQNTLNAVEWLRQFRLAEPWWLPSTHAARAVTLAQSDPAAAAVSMAVLWVGGLAALGFAWWLGGRGYLDLWLRTRDAAGDMGARSGLVEATLGRLWRRPRGRLASLMLQEAARFWRRGTQRMQLVFLGTLLAIFLYNLFKMPLQDPEVAGMRGPLFLVSCGLSCLILVAVTARFSFPATAMEGDAAWMLRASPVPARWYLAWRWLLAWLPLQALALLLLLFCAFAIRPEARMLVAGAVLLVLAPSAFASLSSGLGVAWAKPGLDDPESMTTGVGGVLLMTWCGLYLALALGLMVPVLSEVQRLSLSSRFTPRWLALVVPLAAFAAAHTLAVWLPLRFGLERLHQGD